MINFCRKIFPISLLGAGVLLTAVPSYGGLHDSRTDKSSGEKIYHNYCSVCHGDRGDGKSRAQNSFANPPRDFTAPEAKNLTRDYMLSVIRDGKPGTAMIGWKTQLNDKQIETVVDYVRTKFIGLGGPASEGKPVQAASAKGQPAAGPQASVDMSMPLPKGLVGNVSKGRDFFMKNCSTCHGTLGDGKGPRAYFINPKPENFLTPESKSTFNRPALFAAVSNGKLGTEMPAWSKVLSDQEIANVAEFVFQQFIQAKAQSAKSDKSSK